MRKTPVHERIALFDRNGTTRLEDIAEAVGHGVSKNQVVNIPEDFNLKGQRHYLDGCSTLIFVGASKVEDTPGYTRHIPFAVVEDIARSRGVKTIYRLHNTRIEGARKGTNYETIEQINL